ncbi:hypothetical protein L1887_25257 [Cichorium endivia]|nr:hypothetical protein L1887_25257 [Cichorium endivia]
MFHRSTVGTGSVSLSSVQSRLLTPFSQIKHHRLQLCRFLLEHANRLGVFLYCPSDEGFPVGRIALTDGVPTSPSPASIELIWNSRCRLLSKPFLRYLTLNRGHKRNQESSFFEV